MPMMTLSTSISISIITLWAIKTSNPVKTSMSILFISLSMFMVMAFYSGQTWIPILMLMLFMGGIIMMFMILSSVLPNEKTTKSKNLLMFFVVFFILTTANNCLLPQEKMGMQMKSFLSSSLNFYLMMTLILIYFLVSLSILTTEEAPMRAVSCF